MSNVFMKTNGPFKKKVALGSLKIIYLKKYFASILDRKTKKYHPEWIKNLDIKFITVNTMNL